MKNLEISKELLSEVLKLEVVKHSLFNKSNKSFNITYMPSEDSLKSRWMPINICEFAFKCKVWAFKKGFIIDIGVHPVIKRDRNDRDYFYTIQLQNGELLEVSNSDDIFKSEATAVFKACDWIMENIK